MTITTISAIDNLPNDTKINFYSKVNRPGEVTEITLEEAFAMIKGTKYKNVCDKLKETPNKDDRREIKSNSLPAVTFQGTFTYRKNEALKSFSGLSTLDIDDYSGKADVIKKEIIADPYTLACFESPSGGIKLIVRIPTVENDDQYKIAYAQLVAYFSKYTPKNDDSTKDISRLCFLSYDPNLYLNYAAKTFPVDFSKKLDTDEIAVQEDKQIEKSKDTSRSAKEFREVIKLVGQGKTQEEVLQEMKAFKKWTTAPQGYRDMTYKKAVEYIKKNGANKKKKTKKEDKPIQKSLIIDEENQIIYEQVYQNGISKFCKYDCKTDTFEYVDEYQDGLETIVPINGQEIQMKAIFLPDQPLPYGSNAQLDKEIMEHIHAWLDVPKDFKMFALWNIKRSWVFERFHTLNYLRALGDTGQGKSRFLDTLGLLHYKPIATSGATTSAPVFRILQKWRGTLIMDEADFGQSDESQDIIKIINMGYERGKYVMRCQKNEPDKIDFFDPYGPKILATRRTFQDKAVESRCMTQVMVGTSRRDIAFNLNPDFFQKTQELRNKLLMWRFKNFFKIKQDTKYDLNLGQLEPRVTQIVTSFVSLFVNDEEQLKLFKEFILDYQDSLITERQNTFEGEIVGGIYGLFKKNILSFSVSDIINEGNITNRSGNQVATKTVSSVLKSLGLETGKPQKIDGKTKRLVEFSDTQIINLFQRYGYAVTKVTLVTGTTKFLYNIDEDVLVYESLYSEPNKVTKKHGNHIQRNLRNSVTEEKKDDTQKFDKKYLVYHKCSFENCNETECNFDENNKPLCKEHF